MGAQFAMLTDQQRVFIAAQHLFFIATATADSRINLSPKGMDSFRVLSDTRVVWLNVTGSGNETAAHVLHDGRMTVMFCAFDGAPLILRLYGRATVVHHNDAAWAELAAHFPPLPGARQIFDLHVELVQSSCGIGIPLLDYGGERNLLADWAAKKGEAGIQQYWQDRNQLSIDALPSDIVAKNLKS